MNALRLPVAALSGLLLSVALLWLMQILVSAGSSPALSRADRDPLIEFVRLKQETETRTKQRVLPDRPKPAQAPPPRPRIRVSQRVTPAVPKLNFQADPDLALHLSGGPSLGALASFEPDHTLMPVSRTPPRYPYQAKRRGIEGWVRVSFTVTGSGEVEDIVVEEAEPPGVFEQAALAAVARWKFRPRSVDGQSVAGRAEQLVEFKLQP
jgi:protein TonB